MPRTRWVLNWPGQVTIAGCQTYWTMEVAEALEASNLSNQLFPQLAQQVGVRGICSPHTPRTWESPVSPELSPVMSLQKAWGWLQRAERSDAPEMCLKTNPPWEGLGSKESSAPRRVALSQGSLKEPCPATACGLSLLCAPAPDHTHS